MKTAASALWGKLGASAWNWQGGTKSGVLFDGSKFSGSLYFPSKWNLDHAMIRDRARIAYWDSVQARAIIGRLSDHVIGTGLALEARPLWDILAPTMAEASKHKKVREIEQRFDLWMQSREVDAAGRLSGYELQIAQYVAQLLDGETFHVLRYVGGADRLSPLTVQTILADSVQTPYGSAYESSARAAGRKIVDGIEIDAYGREIAIYVLDSETGKFTRIPFFGPSGRRFVLHPMVLAQAGSVRGVSILAGLIHELQKITDYTVAELEAAVINAIIATYIKPSQDAPASRALQGVRRGNEDVTTAGQQTSTPVTTFDKPGLIVQTLKPGEDVVSFDTKRPNVNFGEFVRHITRHLTASIGIPIEVLEESFNQNYSASRASLLLFWQKVEIERTNSASQMWTPVYEAWFAEEVRLGRIQADGFLDGGPLIRRAWMGCAWNGDKQPSIDPQKEALADRTRIEDGATTRERVAMEYNGSDYNENVRRLKQENADLAEANAPLEAKQAAPLVETNGGSNAAGN